jgi:HlyD family secretion protein
LTITSPISGVISEKFVDVGQELSPGTKVLTIVSNNSTEVELYLSSDEIKFLKVGESVDVMYA